MTISDILNYVWHGNTMQQYLIALAIFVVGVFILKGFKYIIIHELRKFAKKTKNKYDDLLIDSIDAIDFMFYIVVMLYVALQFITPPDIVNKIMYYVVLAAVVYYILKGFSVIIDYGKRRIIETKKKKDEKLDPTIIDIFSKILKISIWIIAFLVIVQNLGYNVTGVFAGLGVMGLAIAFGLQSVLGDLFASFSIFLDKPFVVGDFIIIGNDMGNVREIGLKSTRIRTLQGQELVVSNKELTETRINNYKVMIERRALFSIGVAYETPTKKLKEIPKIIKDIIVKAKDARFDRAHFKSFGDFSLNYEVVYYITSNDYTKYMDIQQEINLKIKEAFEKKR